jgi:hypothetical protein
MLLGRRTLLGRRGLLLLLLGRRLFRPTWSERRGSGVPPVAAHLRWRDELLSRHVETTTHKNIFPFFFLEQKKNPTFHHQHFNLPML